MSINKLKNAWITTDTTISPGVSLRNDGITQLAATNITGTLNAVSGATIDFRGSPFYMDGNNISPSSITQDSVINGYVDTSSDQSLYGEKTFGHHSFMNGLDIAGEDLNVFNNSNYYGINLYDASSITVNYGAYTTNGTYYNNGNQFQNKVVVKTTSSTLGANLSGCMIHVSTATGVITLTLPLMSGGGVPGGYWYMFTVQTNDCLLLPQSPNKFLQTGNSSAITLKAGNSYMVHWTSGFDWSVGQYMFQNYTDLTSAQTIDGNKTLTGTTGLYTTSMIAGSVNKLGIGLPTYYVSMNSNPIILKTDYWHYIKYVLNDSVAVGGVVDGPWINGYAGGVLSSGNVAYANQIHFQWKNGKNYSLVPMDVSGVLTTTAGITATATQTINFGTNAPAMSGASITSGTIPAAAISGGVCDLTNNQTISGVKTFSSLPISSASVTASNQLITKAYADATYTGGSILASNNTFTGTNSFQNTVNVYDSSGVNRNLSQMMRNIYTDASGNISLTTRTSRISSMYFTGSTTQSRIDMEADIMQIGALSSEKVYFGAGVEFQFGIPTYAGGETAPSASNQFMTKSFCDNAYVDVTTNESIGGVKTFTSSPVVPGIGFSNANNSVNIGTNAGIATTSVTIGKQAGQSFGTGQLEQVAIGYQALANHTSGSYNSAIGAYAMISATTGCNANTGIGSAAGAALYTNCNYNFAMGASCMSNGYSAAISQTQYIGATATSTTFTLVGSSAIPGQLAVVYGPAGANRTTVSTYDTSTNTMVFTTSVGITQNVWVIFYDNGKKLTGTITTGGTGTTFTISTGLSISAGYLFSYLETTKIKKYATVSSYNSGTGVIVLTTSITILSASTVYIFDTNVNSIKGNNIVDNCSIGKYSCANITSNALGNTAFGTAALNGQGGTYDNITFASFTRCTAIGLNSGATCTGFSQNCTFLGAYADVYDRTYNYIINSTAIGYYSRITKSNQVVIATASETTEIPGGLVLSSPQTFGFGLPTTVIYPNWVSPTTVTATDTLTAPLYGTYLVNATAATTTTLPAITTEMVGFPIRFRKIGNLATVISVAAGTGNNCYPLNSVTTSAAGVAVQIMSGTQASATIIALNTTSWAVL